MAPKSPWKLVESSMVIALCWQEEEHILVTKRAKNLPIWFLNDGQMHRYVRVGTLYVAYHTGDVYKYEQVSEADYSILLNAESVGRAVNKLLKPSRRALHVGKLDPNTIEERHEDSEGEEGPPADDADGEPQDA